MGGGSICTLENIKTIHLKRGNGEYGYRGVPLSCVEDINITPAR